jgi:acyl-CoA thioester hydrolase
MLTSRTQIRVRYAETDMMSIAYHGSYLPWIEIGRTELLRENGFPYADLEERGYRLPVIEVGVRYIRPALYDDMVTIETTMAEKPILRIRLEYRLLRGDTVLATAQTVHAFINRDNEPVRPPREFSEALERWFAPRA